jgi:hypothetical protein
LRWDALIRIWYLPQSGLKGSPLQGRSRDRSRGLEFSAVFKALYSSISQLQQESRGQRCKNWERWQRFVLKLEANHCLSREIMTVKEFGKACEIYSDV